ncbi:MAG: tetratricopeptide repeat protein [Verrucomicrobia bacterium]|nr:tetratricopeptide repeat protein [Verrucomicrobiota bacterium]
MQHVTAFSRPQTVPAPPAAAARPNLWILNSWRDLILYVGTPLLLLPIFALAQSRWSAQDIYLFVAAFGAMGHHLPGMIRAYGDRALFNRFRWRFIIAPVFLLVTCTVFYWWDLKSIILIVFFWGVWHGMMQTYGFCRIYDAKTGAFATFNKRLDFALCLIWFAAAVFLSPQRMTDTLGVFYSSGGPFIPAAVLRAFQQALFVVAIGVAILFLGNFIRVSRAAKRPNPVKLALLTTSIAFWWYCNNGVSNLLVGIALFEVFHDVQYLSLVWIYNRNRVEKDNSIGGFMRFIFRRSGSLVGLYLGLIFAYGSLAYFNSHLQIETIKRILTGVVTASALLHFYYDGFIWKVRESSTRQSLGLSGGTADISNAGFGWLLHGAKWVGAFVLPLGVLLILELHSAISPVQRAAWIAQDLPNGARPHFDYGTALQKQGQLDGAAREFRTALEYGPKDAAAHYHLALVLQDQAKFDAAAEEYGAALPLDPKNAALRYDYAYTLRRLGRGDEAAAQISEALRINPDFGPALYQRGATLLGEGKTNEAIELLRRAVDKEPKLVNARLSLGSALLASDDLNRAAVQFEEVLREVPDAAEAMNGLGLVYLRKGETSQAIVQFDEALRLKPDFADAAENLRLAKASDSRFRSRR